MLELNSIQSTPVVHGTARLSTVEIGSYDVEDRDNDGFVGRSRQRRAFGAAHSGEDPFGDAPISTISKQRFDAALTDGESKAVGSSKG